MNLQLHRIALVDMIAPAVALVDLVGSVIRVSPKTNEFVGEACRKGQSVPAKPKV